MMFGTFYLRRIYLAFSFFFFGEGEVGLMNDGLKTWMPCFGLDFPLRPKNVFTTPLAFSCLRGGERNAQIWGREHGCYT